MSSGYISEFCLFLFLKIMRLLEKVCREANSFNTAISNLSVMLPNFLATSPSRDGQQAQPGHISLISPYQTHYSLEQQEWMKSGHHVAKRPYNALLKMNRC